MLLDSESMRTFVTEALAKKMQVKKGEESDIMVSTFGSAKPQQYILCLKAEAEFTPMQV